MIKKKKCCRSGWLCAVSTFWIILSGLCWNVLCLKDLKIFIPEAVIMGNSATLSCQYDLERAALYSVRWYFESEEFYRYVPKENPPAREFHVAGITVDLASSDSTSVSLRSVTRELSGQFQCEVSEDAPLFHTDIRSARMQVVELPEDTPVLQIDKKVISSSDNFKATCTVGKSYPGANITWFINGRKIFKTPFQRISYRAFDGTPTFSSLDVYPHSQVFQEVFQLVPKYKNSLVVVCEVSILHVYHKNIQQRLFLSDNLPTTVSPNLLGLEGYHKGANANGGDPDNSPLTGGQAKKITIHISNCIWWLILCIYLL